MSKPAPPLSLAKPKPPSRSEAAVKFASGGAADKGDTARLNANIKTHLHRKLKAKAATEGKTIGALIEEWIQGL